MELKLDIEKTLEESSKKAISSAMEEIRLYEIQSQITEGLKTKLDEVGFAQSIIDNVSIVITKNKDNIVDAAIKAMEGALIKSASAIGQQLVIQMLTGVFLGHPSDYDTDHKNARAKAEGIFLQLQNFAIKEKTNGN